MKYCLFLLIVCLGITGGEVYSQTAIMSGMVLDEVGKPVPGARVKISRKREAKDYWVGADGMYYSLLLSAGYYYHVDIRAKDKYYQSRMVYLYPSAGDKKTYYNFILKGEKAILFRTDKYPADLYKEGKLMDEVPKHKR